MKTLRPMRLTPRGQEASLARKIARTFRRRIHPAIGHSIREDERCFNRHCRHSISRDSGRSRTTANEKFQCSLPTRYGGPQCKTNGLADPTRSHVRRAASIVCPRKAVAQPILSVWMGAVRPTTGNFNRSTSRQYLPGSVSPRDNEHKRSQSLRAA